MAQTLEQKYLLVMQAHFTGREVQYFSPVSMRWVTDYNPDPKQWSGLEYRIKPEVRDEQSR